MSSYMFISCIISTMHTHSPLRRGSPPAGGFAHPKRNVGALDIEPGMHIADFGSGSGAYTLAIAERMEGAGHVYAIDIQKDLLRRTANEAARRGLKNVNVLWADVEEPHGSKLSNGIMDIVLISNLLFQVSDKHALFSEARRIMKSVGRLAVIDWSGSSSSGGQSLGPVKEDIVKKDAAIELAGKVGFKLCREFNAGAHHYGLIFRPVAMKE